MRSNFDACFDMIMVHEGGFSNHPRDPGGMTNLGIIATEWAKWTGKPATESVMRALTRADVKPLYKAQYWDKLRCDDLPSGLDWAVFDFGVNSGIVRSAKYLQRIVGVDADGVIGPKTLAAVNAHDAEELTERLCAARMDFLRALPTFDVFGKGWSRRVQEVQQQAKNLMVA